MGHDFLLDFGKGFYTLVKTATFWGGEFRAYSETNNEEMLKAFRRHRGDDKRNFEQSG